MRNPLAKISGQPKTLHYLVILSVEATQSGTPMNWLLLACHSGLNRCFRLNRSLLKVCLKQTYYRCSVQLVRIMCTNPRTLSYSNPAFPTLYALLPWPARQSYFFLWYRHLLSKPDDRTEHLL